MFTWRADFFLPLLAPCLVAFLWRARSRRKQEIFFKHPKSRAEDDERSTNSALIRVKVSRSALLRGEAFNEWSGKGESERLGRQTNEPQKNVLCVRVCARLPRGAIYSNCGNPKRCRMEFHITVRGFSSLVIDIIPVELSPHWRF